MLARFGTIILVLFLKSSLALAKSPFPSPSSLSRECNRKLNEIFAFAGIQAAHEEKGPYVDPNANVDRDEQTNDYLVKDVPDGTSVKEKEFCTKSKLPYMRINVSYDKQGRIVVSRTGCHYQFQANERYGRSAQNAHSAMIIPTGEYTFEVEPRAKGCAVAKIYIPYRKPIFDQKGVSVADYRSCADFTSLDESVGKALEKIEMNKPKTPRYDSLFSFFCSRYYGLGVDFHVVKEFEEQQKAQAIQSPRPTNRATPANQN
jgi:hypothetical protein